MKLEFNPEEWLGKEKAGYGPVPGEPCSGDSHTGPSIYPTAADKQSIELSADVDAVISRIEAAFEDITTSYADWVLVGFAFVNEFGEAGRKFYHRVSRFYAGYTKAATDKQYDHCLKSQGHGITIGTFYYMAKQAGIEVKGNEKMGPERVKDENPQEDAAPLPLVPSGYSEDAPTTEELPTLPDTLFLHLPEFFKRVVVKAGSKEERDMLFLGALVTLSSCLGKFSGYYDNRKVYPNLYLYVTAPASAGKGNLVMCRNLVSPIDEEKSHQSTLEGLMFDQQMREYNAIKNKDLNVDKPQKPPVRMLFIPANNSTTGFYQLLGDNEGIGLLFETEGDTLTMAFKTDYGNFSDGVRKAFHHEPISYYRRTDRENVRIHFPRLSMVISSTVGQLSGLIPNVENGLASRFMFYYMNLKPVWKDVLAHDINNSWDDHSIQLGQEFYSLYNSLKSAPDIDFMLKPEQHHLFNAFFTQLQVKYVALNGLDTLAIVRRLGLISYRIMMVLTAMRIPETGDFSKQQECTDDDFQSALSIANILVRHASYVISQLPAGIKNVRGQNSKEKFFEGLGERFSRKDFVALAKSLNINERTAERYVAAFCQTGLIVKTDYSSYQKKAPSEEANYMDPG